MIGLLKDIFGGIITVLKSKYKLIFILFFLPTNAYPNSVIIVVIQFCCNKHIMGIHSIVCILLGFPEFSDDNALDMDNVTF